MQKIDSLVASGIRLALILLFFHRCILVYNRWSLHRTQTFQMNHAVTGKEPFPGLTFIFAWNRNIAMLSKEQRLKSFVWQADLLFNGTYK